ncbi:MAG: hypothetical protein IPL32_18700 [Chloracidobacterium sp.]|nr:hypothetical protein [Chloracidobacterium sp.]
MAENALSRLYRNPYAPIDAASVTRIDEIGNGLDDWGNIIAPASQLAAPQSWGELAYGVATAPMRFGNALLDGVNPYKGNEHPITDPNASNWQVPPILSESWDAINSFGNAYHNGMSEDDMRRNANIAAGLTMGGGGIAARPAGGVGMFAGRLAKTADHEALARAEQMATQGADRRAIWDNTGWFQGPDQKWRFEIDDSGAKLSDWNWNRANDTAGITQESSIGGGIEHPYLWDAYPDIADADMRLMKTLDDGSGAWSRDSRTAYVRGRTEPEARSVGLHEVQHAIQGDEGFARGGNRGMFTPDEIAAERARIGAVPEDNTGWSGVGTGAGDAPDTDIALGLYKRLAGETEARNVQTRMNYTPEQRKASPPWETQDIPYEDQIVRMLAANASKEAGATALASALDMSPEARLARARAHFKTARRGKTL